MFALPFEYWELMCCPRKDNESVARKKKGELNYFYCVPQNTLRLIVQTSGLRQQ
jgi:hypothetical protein